MTFDGNEFLYLLEMRNGKWLMPEAEIKNEQPYQAVIRLAEDCTGVHPHAVELSHASTEDGDMVLHYLVTARLMECEGSDDYPNEVQWFQQWHEEMQHKANANTAEHAMQTLRDEAFLRPILFSMLPEEFPMANLQRLYEQTYQRTLDRRNFRKHVRAMDMVDEREDPTYKGHYMGRLKHFPEPRLL